MTRHALTILVTAAALAAPAAAQDGAAGLTAPPSSRRLIVTVHTRDDRGRVFCALWRGPEGYPTVRARAVGRAMDRTIEDGIAVCVFEGVSPGEYAVAVIHDENDNNDLDRNFLGIPSEGTGASNDAHNPFGPPRYHDARFIYPRDARALRLTVHVRY